jgi:CBS-domain-containing membrane protein
LSPTATWPSPWGHGLSLQTPAREIMTRHVIAIPDKADVLTATKFMRDCEVRRLPIVDEEDRLVGIVTLDDLLSRLGLELYNLAEGIKTEMEVK